MSLDVYLKCPHCRAEVFSRNITHNLNAMAKQAELYQPLWRPEEIGIAKAVELIPALETGLKSLRENPAHFKTYNPENGWGNYDILVQFVTAYLEACQAHPDCIIDISR
jgi:hypothetical protein